MRVCRPQCERSYYNAIKRDIEQTPNIPPYFFRFLISNNNNYMRMWGWMLQNEVKEKKLIHICIAMHYGAQNVKHVSEFTHVPNKCTLYVIAMY